MDYTTDKLKMSYPDFGAVRSTSPGSAATVYIPPALSPAQLHAAGILGRTRRPFEFETALGLLMMTPCHPGGLVQEGVPYAGVRLSMSGDFMTLWIPAGALSSILYRTEPDVSLAQILPVTRALIFEGLFAELFDELEHNGLALRVDEVTDPVRNPQGQIGVNITLADLPGFSAVVEGEPHVVARVLAWVERLPVMRKNFDALPVIARVVAGVTFLPSDALANLRSGDAVVFDMTWLPQKRAPVVVGERLIRACQVEGKGFIVMGDPPLLDVRERHMWLMEGDMSVDRGPGTEPDVTLVDDLEVKLTFELGRTQLNVGEMERIEPGYVFELNRQPNQAVDIYVLNKLVGWGELVMVADKIGVRITKIFK